MRGEFYYTIERSVGADDIAEQLVEQMYNDGASFADLINVIAKELYANDLEDTDVANYAQRLDDNGKVLIRQLASCLPTDKPGGS